MNAQLQNAIGQLRDIKPEDIRARLLEIEAEEKSLRILLRTVQSARAAGDSIGRAEADRYERQFQAIQQSARETKAALDAIEREGQR
jgi:hypothetical protein